MSIRLRLTLLYSFILALTLVAFSVTLYITVSRVAWAAVETTLREEARRVTASKDFRLDNIGSRVYRVGGPQTYIQTRLADRQVGDRTSNLGEYELPISDDAWRTCQAGQPWTEVITTDSGRLLVYNVPVDTWSDDPGVLQVARSLVDYDQSLDTLRGILAAGSVGATLITFGLGWGLAGAALRPIHKLTQTAQAIGAERTFERRIPNAGPDDEVGRLTTTLNIMLTELQSAYRQMEQTVHNQRRFVGDASHELRTPLTTIRGNLGLLQREPPISPADQAAVLADAVEECDRLIRLVNSLLALARADSGLKLHRAPIAVAGLMDDLCRQVRGLAPDRLVQCEAGEALWVEGDRDSLKQVMLILVDNALKYTPGHGAITLTAEAGGEGQVSLRVRDTGQGIPPAALPFIFERFYRVESARSSGGAGLGLAIAKELVEAMGGAISVESQEGQGSQFIVTLPRAAAPSAETGV